jgi:hypothetical protein
MSLSENYTNPLFIYSIHWLIMLIVYHVLPPEVPHTFNPQGPSQSVKGAPRIGANHVLSVGIWMSAS